MAVGVEHQPNPERQQNESDDRDDHGSGSRSSHDDPSPRDRAPDHLIPVAKDKLG